MQCYLMHQYTRTLLILRNLPFQFEIIKHFTNFIEFPIYSLRTSNINLFMAEVFEFNLKPDEELFNTLVKAWKSMFCINCCCQLTRVSKPELGIQGASNKMELILANFVEYITISNELLKYDILLNDVLKWSETGTIEFIVIIVTQMLSWICLKLEPSISLW